MAFPVNVGSVKERPGSWLPRLSEVSERLAEEWQSARRPREQGDAPPTPQDMRASDGDRDRVAQILNEAFADGRLGMPEFEERLEATYQARTLGELAGITLDLLPESEQPFRLDDGRPLTAIFRKEHRDGRWVVPAEMAVTAVFGTTTLDLHDAILQSHRVVINATLLMGTLQICVPEGVEVYRVTKEKTVRLTRQQTMPDCPVIEVHTTTSLGEVKVKEPPKRKRRR